MCQPLRSESTEPESNLTLRPTETKVTDKRWVEEVGLTKLTLIAPAD